jgi:hypothetical protein
MLLALPLLVVLPVACRLTQPRLCWRQQAGSPLLLVWLVVVSAAALL